MTRARPAAQTRIRNASPADLDAATIAGPKGIYRSELNSWLLAADRGEAGVLVATIDTQPVGRVAIGLSDNRWAWVSSLMVAPDYRRRGVARSLMAAAHDVAIEARHAEIRLAVGKANDPALALYLGMGYEVVRARRTSGLRADGGTWIHAPEDAWELRLRLQPPPSS